MHRAQIEVAGELTSGVEAETIVRDFEGNPSGSASYLYPHAARSGMFHRVVQGFLCDTVQSLLRLQGSLRFIAEICLDHDLMGLIRLGGHPKIVG